MGTIGMRAALAESAPGRDEARDRILHRVQLCGQRHDTSPRDEEFEFGASTVLCTDQTLTATMRCLLVFGLLCATVGVGGPMLHTQSTPRYNGGRSVPLPNGCTRPDVPTSCTCPSEGIRMEWCQPTAVQLHKHCGGRRLHAPPSHTRTPRPTHTDGSLPHGCVREGQFSACHWSWSGSVPTRRRCTDLEALDLTPHGIARSPWDMLRRARRDGIGGTICLRRSCWIVFRPAVVV